MRRVLSNTNDREPPLNIHDTFRTVHRYWDSAWWSKRNQTRKYRSGIRRIVDLIVSQNKQLSILQRWFLMDKFEIDNDRRWELLLMYRLGIRSLKLHRFQTLSRWFDLEKLSHRVHRSTIIAQHHHCLLVVETDLQWCEIHGFMQFNQRMRLFDRSVTADRILEEAFIILWTRVQTDVVETLKRHHRAGVVHHCHVTYFTRQARCIRAEKPQTTTTSSVDETSFDRLKKCLLNIAHWINTDGMGGSSGICLSSITKQSVETLFHGRELRCD